MTNDLVSQKSILPKFNKPRQGEFSLIPEGQEFGKNFILHRIKLPSIEITEKTRDSVEQAMGKGSLFVRVADHTIMVNSIAGIDPLPVKRVESPIPELPELTKEQKEQQRLKLAELKNKLLLK